MRLGFKSNLYILLGTIFLFTALFSSFPDVKHADANLQLEERQLAPLLPAEQSPRPATITQPPAAVGSAPGTAEPTKGYGESSAQAVPITPAPGTVEIPIRLVIPSIGLDAPIIPAKTKSIKVAGGQEYQQWQAPNQFAAGWHDSSALLGQPGNTVLNGHHNVYGKVFSRLVDLKEGDLIIVSGTDKTYEYSITNKMILPEKYQQLDVRMDNARWILPSVDERLTLITCWPATNNTHRLIIVAKPLGLGGG